jgi:F-box protein 21
VSWNVKYQESSEWKSEVGSDDEEDYDEEDYDDFEDAEVDEDNFENVEVDEDEACSRTKEVVPSQDQPHYHILMVDSDEHNPQLQLNVPEGN